MVADVHVLASAVAGPRCAGGASRTGARARLSTSLGVLPAAYARTDAQVSGLGRILILVLVELGGCMVPLVFMPDFMSDLAAFTPHG